MRNPDKRSVAATKCVQLSPQTKVRCRLTRDVVDLAVDSHPAAVCGVVAGHLLPGELLLAAPLGLSRTCCLSLAQRGCCHSCDPAKHTATTRTENTRSKQVSRYTLDHKRYFRRIPAALRRFHSCDPAKRRAPWISATSAPIEKRLSATCGTNLLRAPEAAFARRMRGLSGENAL